MTFEGPLPYQSDSQRIGNLAEKCFIANRPNDWLPQNLAGTDDFGFDYQIQTLVQQRVTDVFLAQLKGKSDPRTDASGHYFGVQLKASTVRYYARATLPILLVLADLGIDLNRPANCPLYYCWIHEELRRINESGLPPDQEFVTLRVPTENRLTEATDLSDDLARFRQLAKVGDALDVVAERHHPGMPAAARAGLVEKIPSVLAQSSSTLFRVLTDEPESAWPEAPVGTIPWYLRQAFQRLRVGDTAEVQRLLGEAEPKLADATNLELVEFSHLTGMLLSSQLEEKAARDAYAKAANLSNGAPRHVVAWAESELRLRFEVGKQTDFSDVLARLSGTDSLSISMRARLLAAEGRYSEASEAAGSISGIEGRSTRAIIYTMQSQFENALEECNAGLQEPNMRDAAKQLFLILRARAYFHLAVGSRQSDLSETPFPILGPAGTKVSMLLEAWKCIQLAIESLRAAGWPTNTELFADIWSATASMLGLHSATLPILTQAAGARQYFPVLQSALEVLAIQDGDFELALTANSRLPDTEAKTLRRIGCLHLLRKDSECVALFESVATTIDASEDLLGFAAVTAAISADRLVKTNLVNTWIALIDAIPRLSGHRALLDYLLSTSRNLLAKDDALVRLEQAYEALGRPFLVGMHFFQELDAGNRQQAEKIAIVAPQLAATQMLPQEAMLHLAQALATLGHWQQLLDLAIDGQARFEKNARLIAVEAMALDRLGRSAEAMEALNKVIGAGLADKFALNIYINIVVRCGFTDEAIVTVERILAVETNAARKIEALRLLFNLNHYKDPLSSRGLDIAWRMGQVVRQNDEAEEGLFLILMIAATSQAALDPSDTRLITFHKRLKTYTTDFPNSAVLRSFQFPENASAAEMAKILRSISGLDDEKLRWREKIQREMQRGEVPVPFEWRPRQLLGNVPDVPTLWAVSKNSKSHERQYHLLMAANDWAPIESGEICNHVPLLDLITLLVLTDLDLFEFLFQVFPKIAISQETLLRLPQLLSPMTGSPLRQQCLDLQEALKKRFSQIIQPWADLSEEVSNTEFRLISEEIKKLISTGRYRLYSDDAVFRVFVDPAANVPTPMCTLDLLAELERRKLLSAKDASLKYARLCSWHVGLVISLRYQIGVLPDSLGDVKSVSEGIDILRASPDFSAVFDAIWDPQKPFLELVAHGASILRAFVDNPSNSLQSISAVLGFWLGKARLRGDADHSPIEKLAQVIFSAGLNGPNLSEEVSRRLWTVFRNLVEVEYGQDRMDELREREAIEIAGDFAARAEQNSAVPVGNGVYARFLQGLTAGTSDAAAFSNGYTKGLAGLARKGEVKNIALSSVLGRPKLLR